MLFIIIYQCVVHITCICWSYHSPLFTGNRNFLPFFKDAVTRLVTILNFSVYWHAVYNKGRPLILIVIVI